MKRTLSKWKLPSTEKETAELLQFLLTQVVVNENTKCWEWTGKRNKAGYGQFRLHKLGTGVHRLICYLIHDRTIYSSNRKVACHRCDNPPCINPMHLFVGNHRDNFMDSYFKGRRAHVKTRKLFSIDIEYCPIPRRNKPRQE